MRAYEILCEEGYADQVNGALTDLLSTAKAKGVDKISTPKLVQALAGTGMQGLGFYPNGTFVKLGKTFHVRMSMSTIKTMEYALSSHTTRLSLRVKPLQCELRRAIKKAKLAPVVEAMLTRITPTTEPKRTPAATVSAEPGIAAIVATI